MFDVVRDGENTRTSHGVVGGRVVYMRAQAARVIPTKESASDRTDQASLRKHMSDIPKYNIGFAFASQEFA